MGIPQKKDDKGIYFPNIYSIDVNELSKVFTGWDAKEVEQEIQIMVTVLVE